MAYTKINFQNLPNTTTPVNATNLNALQTNVETALNDKADTSSIPTVNDATLTIQKNGTTLDTFTANASVDKTINITTAGSISELATVLYNPQDGIGTNGNVTLSETAEHFDYLVVYYGNSGGSNRKAEIIYKPHGKTSTLTMNNYYKESASNFYQYYYSKQISISGTTITDVQDWELRMLNRTVSNSTQDNRIYIFRVEGYN